MLTKKPLWHPTREQEILLKISLAENRGEAQLLWGQWSAESSISRLQNESYLLLKSAISNMLSLGVPLSKKVKNISHQTAVRNMVAIRNAQQVAREFAKNKIPLYALKGLALYVSGIYSHSHMRAMHDVDFYINGNYLEKALKILQSSGWIITESNKAGYSVVLALPGFPGKIDLHYRPIWFQLAPGVIASIEKDTETILFKGSPLRIMKPELQLVYILVHGARCGINDYSSTQIPHLRWIIDAYYLLGKEGINWKHFLNWVKLFEAGIQVNEALKLLQERFKIPVPPSVVAELKNMPKTRRQKLHARYCMAYAQPRLFKIPRRLRASFHAWLLLNRTPAYINSLTFKKYTKEFGLFLKEGFSLDKNQSISLFILKKILSKPRLLLP
ncbi:MAG: nucleotidyltransferase family protein [Candidatus Levyibacteriota bacterium]